MDVLAGKIAISPDIDHELALSRLAGESSAADVLTPREFEVLRLLLAENTTEEIAETLHVSPKTVGESAFADQGQARRRDRHRAGPAGAAPEY